MRSFAKVSCTTDILKFVKATVIKKCYKNMHRKINYYLC